MSSTYVLRERGIRRGNEMLCNLNVVKAVVKLSIIEFECI